MTEGVTDNNCTQKWTKPTANTESVTDNNLSQLGTDNQIKHTPRYTIAKCNEWGTPEGDALSKRMRSSKKYAENCALCESDLQKEQAIGHIKLQFYQPNGFGGCSFYRYVDGVVCRLCLKGRAGKYRIYPKWCNHCRKAIFSRKHSDFLSRVFCCDRCEWNYYNERKKRPMATIAKCNNCGDEFKPKRIDAKTCSSKCRQAAYRKKNKPNTN